MSNRKNEQYANVGVGVSANASVEELNKARRMQVEGRERFNTGMVMSESGFEKMLKRLKKCKI
jgi:lauroyl/myristoyl acyltransferase